MTGRSRILTAILAVLLLAIPLAASGCAIGHGAFTRTQNGGLEYTEGNNVWSWGRSGNTAQITLNDRLFAVIQGSVAQISLPDGRSLDVVLDGNGTPVSVKAGWGVVLEQPDYVLMNSAFMVHKQGGGQGPSGAIGWAIFLLIVIVAGVLLFLYAGRLVNNWKIGGIFSGRDTAKSLLIFKALGIVLVLVGLILLLTVLF